MRARDRRLEGDMWGSVGGVVTQRPLGERSFNAELQGCRSGRAGPGGTASPPLPCPHPCFAVTHWDCLVFAEGRGTSLWRLAEPMLWLPGELSWGLASRLATEAVLSGGRLGMSICSPRTAPLFSGGRPACDEADGTGGGPGPR